MLVVVVIAARGAKLDLDAASGTPGISGRNWPDREGGRRSLAALLLAVRLRPGGLGGDREDENREAREARQT